MLPNRRAVEGGTAIVRILPAPHFVVIHRLLMIFLRVRGTA